MKSSEECYQSFLQLKQDISKYPLGTQTEADTRARIVDRMLSEVCDWPPENVSREEHAHPGYMDYVLFINRRVAVVEAKRSADSFELPHDITGAKVFTLNGIIRRVANLRLHIDQVTNYCFNNGIEYGVVSNGLQYVIFRAVRVDGIHVGLGRVLVFNGFEDIEKRFVQFWELLAKSSVEANSLQRAFQDSDKAMLQYRRVADQVHAFKEKVTRNDLSIDLEPVISEYMGEIADEAGRDKLQELYVRSQELQSVLNAVGSRISMGLSRTVKGAGRVVERAKLRDFQASVEQAVRSHSAFIKRGEVILILGRVGSGKTTFVNHFLRIQLKDIFKQHLLVMLDFRLLEKGGSVRNFFYDQLRVALTKNDRYTKLTSKELRRVYALEIRELSIGPLAALERQNKKVYEQKIAEYLMGRYLDSESHYPKVLRYLSDKESVRCFLVFDNVDQHDFELQQEIFRFAHSFSGRCHACSIVTMWEETYLRSKQVGGALSAYQSVAYALPPVSVVDIISRRLEYIVSEIRKGGIAAELIPSLTSRGDVADFLALVRSSILHDRRRARHFLESISMGNLRRAIEMFSLFLVSGHTDTSKILEIHNSQHGYVVPLHEFIKSIGLGDYRYYNSELSQVINLFSISDESRPSHFTKIRLLQYLYYHRNRSTAYGLGFVWSDLIKKEFGAIGTSEADIAESLRILSTHLLLENDIYEEGKIGNAYRITGAGRYYLRYLARIFSYLDLACQDTPIADAKAFEQIKELIGTRELGDRFVRVRSFMGYLAAEEEREHAAILYTSESIPLRQKMLPGLTDGFEADVTYIRSRRRRGAVAETPYRTKGEEQKAGPS